MLNQMHYQATATQHAVAHATSAQVAPSVPASAAIAAPSHPAAWHPDPTGRFAQRYWNGDTWTAHVASADGSPEQRPDGVKTDTYARWISVAVAAVLAVFILATPAGAKTSKPTKKQVDRFFAVLTDPTTGLDLDRIDIGSISDGQLLAGGRQFCDELKKAKKSNTDKYLESPTTDDFDAVAQRIGQQRFASAHNLTPSTNGDNGPTVTAYSVGIAAVRGLCPQFTSALG
jgi:hypothetical protein